MGYVVLYYLFGYYVAWQNPELRLYYSGSTELKSFYEQMRSNLGMPWMLLFLVWTGTPMGPVRVSRGQDVEHQEN